MVVVDWTPYVPYFTRQEFECKHTGKCGMQAHFMDELLKLRIAYGKPMRITSGYRDKTHPIEAKKAGTGEHTMGVCCDVAVEGVDAVRLTKLAMDLAFCRFGFNQKGNARFIHIGVGGPGLPSPAMWSY